MQSEATALTTEGGVPYQLLGNYLEFELTGPACMFPVWRMS